MSRIADFARLVGIFLLLQITLFTLLTRISIDLEERWVPRSLLHFERDVTAFVNFLLGDKNLWEASLFSLIGLYAYVGRSKYAWLALSPWLITAFQNWAVGVGIYIKTVLAIYQAGNFRRCVLVLMGLLVTQLLVMAEVLCQALQGWIVMRHLDGERHSFYMWKRYFNEHKLQNFIRK